MAESLLAVSYILSIALHEAGHAVAAWRLRLDVRSVTLGFGLALALVDPAPDTAITRA